MSGTRHAARGTTHLPLAMDITRPSDLLVRRPARGPSLWRWFRPALIVAATAAALAVLSGLSG